MRYGGETVVSESYISYEWLPKSAIANASVRFTIAVLGSPASPRAIGETSGRIVSDRGANR